MKLAALLSGGKDSLLALYRASKYHKIKCLITLESENDFSFMFHTPTINLTELQSRALNIPMIRVKTKGNKGHELLTLRRALKDAVDKFGVEGVVSGAIKSTYQNTRIQKICNDMSLYSFNPLWMNDEYDLLNELIRNHFEVIITAVAAYPLDKSFLGKKIDKNFLKLAKKMSVEHQINPVGEGGEFETLVLDMPLFNKKIVVDQYSSVFHNYTGRLLVNKAHLEKKVLQ